MDAAPYTTPDPDFADLLAARPTLTCGAVEGLCFEDVPLFAIADQFSTPCWVTGCSTLRGRAQALIAAFAAAGIKPSIHFAMKSNDQQAVLATLSGLGIGIDAVSGGEIARARAAGVPSCDIVLSGVGKTDQEIDQAIEAQIAHLNVESVEEMRRVSIRAATLERTIDIVLRVNPDVAADTHDKISTGRAEDKFGIPYETIHDVWAEGCALPGLRMAGLAVHIGSQINEAAPFREAYQKIADLVRSLRADGHQVRVIDCGGGIGIAYRDEIPLDPRAWAATIAAAFSDLDVHLAVEPGRWLSAPAGILLARVIDTKVMPGNTPNLLVLDCGMNDLARPALYGSWHAIVPVAASDLHRPTTMRSVVGPVCESSDVLATARPLPDLQPGALMAILDAGAYGAVMSSTYNSRPLAAQVMVDRGRVALIRPRQALQDLWAQEIIPDWCIA